jgi:hypothetical protein
MPTKNQLVTVTTLKTRGWTDPMIRRFLGEPDKLSTSPYYHSGPRIRLYELARVELTEKSAEFRQVQENRRAKRNAAWKALATKKQKMMQYVETVEIDVPCFPKAVLIDQACDNYNARYDERVLAREYCEDCQRAFDQSDPVFLERICVNYLRHCCTEYETHLSQIAGKVGAREAYHKIKVLEAISEAYVWLSEECTRQKAKLNITAEQLGREAGYPDCCVKFFCEKWMPIYVLTGLPGYIRNAKRFMEEHFARMHAVGVTSGYVPCPECLTKMENARDQEAA